MKFSKVEIITSIGTTSHPQRLKRKVYLVLWYASRYNRSEEQVVECQLILRFLKNHLAKDAQYNFFHGLGLAIPLRIIKS